MKFTTFATSSFGRVKMFGIYKTSTIIFDVWLNNTHGEVDDFFVLRDAVYGRRTRGRFQIENKLDKTYLCDVYGDLVLVLTQSARHAFLQMLNRSCDLAARHA